MEKINTCVCGQDLNEPDLLIDSLYPTKRNKKGNFTEWNIVCQEHNSGCGRVVYGPTQSQVITDWNDGKAVVEI